MEYVNRRHLLSAASLTAGGAVLGLPAAAPAASVSGSDSIVVTPGDPRYHALTVGNNQRWTARPERVVLPVSTAQVVAAVQLAVREGRRIAVRSGGHCYEDFVFHPQTEVVIDLSEMHGVDYDPRMHAFTVQPGATLLRVYDTLYHRWGVTIPGGSCYSVGAGGHIAGGGYGLLSRRNGLTVDHLHAVEVVTVDRSGQARSDIATRDHTGALGDLWWGHTGGGGGNFGVVTRYWLRSPEATGSDPSRLLPRPPSTVLVGGLGLSWADLTPERFARLLDNYGRWHEANSAPGSPGSALSAILALNHRSAGGIGMVAQADGEVPDAAGLVDGFFSAVLDGVGAEVAALTEPRGEFGPMPALVRPQRMPWLLAAKLLATNSPTLTSPVLRAEHKSAYLRRRLRPAQVAALHRHLTREDYANPDAMVVIFGFGGQVNAVPPHATAVAQRDSVLKLLFQSFWADPAQDETHVGWVRDIYGEAFAGTGGVPVPDDFSDGCYVNYPDTDLNSAQWNRSGVPWHDLYYKHNYPRLQVVKAQWDPLNVFRHAQSIRA